MALRAWDTGAWEMDDRFPLLSPQAKFLFLFLVLGPVSHPCGLFVCSHHAVRHHLGLSDEEQEGAWAELEQHGMIEREEGHRVWVKNMARYQVHSPSVWVSTRKHLARWKGGLYERFLEEYPEAAPQPMASPKPRAEALAAAPAPPPVEVDEEVVWRVKVTWEAFLAQRAGFFEDVLGAQDPNPPKIDTQITREIAACLREYDGHLMAQDDREEWVRSSVTRAAGVGLFLDPWYTGADPKTGGKRFLEPWRPWRKNGQGERITQRLADAYFAARAELAEAEARKKGRGRRKAEPPPTDDIKPGEELVPMPPLSELLSGMVKSV